MLPVVTAVRYERALTSGRTRPVICYCSDSNGETKDDYVVKLGNRADFGKNGLANELLSFLLAQHFGITTPEAAIVRITKEFCQAVASSSKDAGERFHGAEGLHFGTRLIVGFTTLPCGRSLPENLRNACQELFAFDCLIYNPDRRVQNPNVLSRSKMLLAYDHELAFSFLQAIPKISKPWLVSKEVGLKNHAFFKFLQGYPVDLKRFLSRLNALKPNVIEDLMNQVPTEWRYASYNDIGAYLNIVRERADEFIIEVKNILS